MRNFMAVYIRELKSYFVSPIFYIVATVFMISVGNTFKDSFFSFATATMRQLRAYANYGGNVQLMNINSVSVNMMTFMNFIFLLIVPLLTMRLYAEEKKNGTMELLMTSPITTTQVLLGKFFSCLSIYFILMVLTMAFNIILAIYSQGKLDWGPIVTGYLGTLLLGASIISIGMFFSSLTENQIVAAAVTLTFLMGMWLLIYSANFLKPPFNDFVRYISLTDHLDYFSSGILGIKHIIYYLSMTLFWLFATGMTVESARWRQ